MPLSPGTQIGSYEILAPIGAGGMGEVYRATDHKLNRKVALKFLPLNLTRKETAKARFVQEAQAASSLDHPSICTVYDIGET
jgi:serine/threonine protein kinase